jgi:HrpA-like RNA helicase
MTPKRPTRARAGDCIQYGLVEQLIRYIHNTQPEGAVLVFLPGWAAISKLDKQLKALPESRSMLVLPVHSMLPDKQQRLIFNTPPSGVRKIVIATNIAETSITIDDVSYVVDIGLINETNYDPVTNLRTLAPSRVSQANAKQRRGRAGRTKPGQCYYMFTRETFDTKLEPFQAPEMLRMPVEEICLQVRP